MEALITESLLAARFYGVEGDVLASLDNLFPHPDWEGHARYMINRTLEHGERRAEEMHEASQTVRDAGIEAWMSDAVTERQSWAGSMKVLPGDIDIGALLDSMRDAHEGGPS